MNDNVLVSIQCNYKCIFDLMIKCNISSNTCTGDLVMTPSGFTDVTPEVPPYAFNFDWGEMVLRQKVQALVIR